jgi:hypothetical protein
MIFYVYKYKQKSKNKSRLTRNKKLLIGTGLVVLVASVAVGLSVYINRHRNSTVSVTTDTGQTVNYSPATKAERKEANDKKDEIVKEQEQKQADTATPNNKASVKPTITNTTGSVNAYVSGIFEEGGTCTAIFTKASTTLTKTTPGFQNVSYTQCAPINLETGFLSTGQWTLIVKYDSEKSSGSSDPQTIEVK